MFVRILLMFLVCFLASDGISVRSTLAASTIISTGSSTLKKTAMAAGMQGRSGIVLDVNGDGVDDLLVGVPETGPLGAKGGFIVYSKFRSLLAPFIKGEGNLGWRMAALGDVNGDGKGDFAVSALNGSGPNVSLAGTVTVYHGDATPQAATLIEGANALDRFGYSLASGDLNGDGVKDL
ncbi:MAG: hypothetical protein ACLGPL_08180, partial [Acidobacteriota bacterium]